jgi:hypothetical protein
MNEIKKTVIDKTSDLEAKKLDQLNKQLETEQQREMAERRARSRIRNQR